MTKVGVLKYGLQLCIVEVTTLGSIFVFKLMIDYLQEGVNAADESQDISPGQLHGKTYAVALFIAFVVLRILTILSRCYYDMHVYNYFRFC